MNLATNLFIIYFVYTIILYAKLIANKNVRKAHQNTRQELDKLRDIPLKSLEQQKQFLDLKYPMTPPFKWRVKNILKVILKLGTMICIFLGSRYLWKTYIVWEFSLWHVLIIVICLPILLNMVLKKYNLQQDDILLYFK